MQIRFAQPLLCVLLFEIAMTLVRRASQSQFPEFPQFVNHNSATKCGPVFVIPQVNSVAQLEKNSGEFYRSLDWLRSLLGGNPLNRRFNLFTPPGACSNALSPTYEPLSNEYLLHKVQKVALAANELKRFFTTG